MTPERPYQRKPYEIVDISEDEIAWWRVSDEKLKEILANPNTTTHLIELASNAYGEFLFLTTSRGTGQQRICMTFYGLGYHVYREHWIAKEWFWHQTPANLVEIQNQISGEEVTERLEQRSAQISPSLGKDTQTARGQMFEQLADLTDDDAALAEMQDLDLL